MLRKIFIFFIITLSATTSYADLGTVTVVNHTDCLCSISSDHQSASCINVPSSGITVYTFAENEQRQPILYSSILNGTTGVAPILPAGQSNITFPTIWVFKNTSGAYTPSSYEAKPNGTLYLISLVTKNFGQLAYPVVADDCPGQLVPNVPFAGSIN